VKKKRRKHLALEDVLRVILAYRIFLVATVLLML
jgi:hypothetical protein